MTKIIYKKFPFKVEILPNFGLQANFILIAETEQNRKIIKLYRNFSGTSLKMTKLFSKYENPKQIRTSQRPAKTP